MDYYMPPPALLQPKSAPQSNSKNVQNISPYVIISVALVASMFLLLSYYIIVVRNCTNWRRRRPSRTQSEGVSEEFLGENRGAVIDHPVWYINTVGLQPSVINLITIFKYKKGDGLIDGTECSVCLNEFQDDASLRLLPKCNHAFHINCIDTWLRSHTNCPLCRAAIVSNTATSAPVGTIGPISSTNMSSNEDYGSQREIIVEVNSNNEARDEEFQENVGRVTGVIERPETSKNEMTIKRGDEDMEVQPMRRFVSMNSSISTTIGLQMAVLPKDEAEKSCVETTRNDEMGSNSRMKRVMESASSMKRSLSYGGRSFFSKQHRNPSSVLPL